MDKKEFEEFFIERFGNILSQVYSNIEIAVIFNLKGKKREENFEKAKRKYLEMKHEYEKRFVKKQFPLEFIPLKKTEKLNTKTYFDVKYDNLKELEKIINALDKNELNIQVKFNTKKYFLSNKENALKLLKRMVENIRLLPPELQTLMEPSREEREETKGKLKELGKSL